METDGHRSNPRTSLSPNEIQRHNDLYNQACRLSDGLMIIDGKPRKRPGPLERSRLQEAIHLFQQVIDLNPTNWQSMFFIGKAFQSLEELEPALTWFLRAHDCVPTNRSVAKEIGGTACRLGQHDVAINVIQAAIKEHPEDAALYVNLGLSYLISGKPTDACNAFERAVGLEPDRRANKLLLDLAKDVDAGKRPCPKTEREVVQAIRQIP
jgi:tetratricopeptide (TPR) repeat protein